MKMSRCVVLGCLWILGCRASEATKSASDAALESLAREDASAAVASNPDGIVEAGGVSPSPSGSPKDGELRLDVQGAYCPYERRDSPGCASYNYVLSADGTLRGGRRRARVAAADVDSLLADADAAFEAKHVCIPFPPDHGGQSITLARNGLKRVARGGCGAAVDAIRSRLEKLAQER